MVNVIKNRYLVLAVTLYFVTAYFSIGHNSPDEYYQILEFAAYKMNFGDSRFLTWEYFYQIRPSIQIWFVIIIYKFFLLFNVNNPFIVAFVLRAFSAILSLVSVFVFIQAFLPSIKHEKSQKWFILLSLFTWLVVYNSVRYSSENISEKLFLLGFSLLFIPRFKKSIVTSYLIGLLFGLSFEVRFQSLLLIIPVYAWLVIINNFSYTGEYRDKMVGISRLFHITMGILIAVGVCVLVDKWFYGNWVFTSWNYLNMNLFHGKAKSFGEQGWYFYLLVAVLLPYGLMYIISSFMVLKTHIKNPVVWILAVYVLGHIVVGHKELRFLVPVLCFMPLVISYSLDYILLNVYHRFVWLNKLWKYSWYLNCILLFFVIVLPSGTNVYLCKFIYENYTKPLQFYAITEGGNELDFYKRRNVELVYIKEVSAVKCSNNKTCLLALTCQQAQLNTSFSKNKVVYDNCPSWMLKLNFNGWLDRAAMYKIYELNSIE